MLRKKRAIYILLLLAGLLGVVAYLGFVYWSFQAQERPTLIYFHAGG